MLSDAEAKEAAAYEEKIVDLVKSARRLAFIEAAEMADSYADACNDEWASSEVRQAAALILKAAEQDKEGR